MVRTHTFGTTGSNNDDIELCAAIFAVDISMKCEVNGDGKRSLEKGDLASSHDSYAA